MVLFQSLSVHSSVKAITFIVLKFLFNIELLALLYPISTYVTVRFYIFLSVKENAFKIKAWVILPNGTLLSFPHVGFFGPCRKNV